jgi:hypothetical protein
MIEHSQDIAAFAKAFVVAQGHMTGAKRDAKNPHFKSTYANLETVIDAAKPALQEQGIMFTQAPGQLIDGALEVTTMLVHAESGQWMRSTVHVPLQKRDPQGVGSAITYACRYSLMATLGLPPVDDDGEGAMDRSQSTGRAAPAQQKEPQPTKADARPIYTALEKDMRLNKNKADLQRWFRDAEVKELRAKLPADWEQNLKQAVADYGRDLPESGADFPGDAPSVSASRVHQPLNA